MKTILFDRPYDFGRLGDQMHYYYRARTYAEDIGADFQMMPWLGEEMFGLKHPRHNPPDLTIDGTEPFLREVVFDQKKAREWFKIPPTLLPHTDWSTVIHLRRGDLLEPTNKMPIIGLKEYEKFLDELHIDLVECKIVSDDNPYANWNKHCPLELALAQDFAIMQMADTLLCGNSGFSQWAGFLGYGKAYYPLIGERVDRCAYCRFIPLLDYFTKYIGAKIV